MAFRRRVFLMGGLGLLGAGALGYGGSLAACAIRGDRLAMLRPLYVALQGGHHEAEIGSAWARVEPLAVAADHLLADKAVFGALMHPDAALRKQKLDSVIRRDFVSGRVVLADRWLVAQSEARIAALRHMDNV